MKLIKIIFTAPDFSSDKIFKADEIGKQLKYIKQVKNMYINNCSKPGLKMEVQHLTEQQTTIQAPQFKTGQQINIDGKTYILDLETKVIRNSKNKIVTDFKNLQQLFQYQLLQADNNLINFINLQ